MLSHTNSASTKVDIFTKNEAAAGATATASNPNNDMTAKIEVDEDATNSKDDNQTGTPLPPGAEAALDAAFELVTVSGPMIVHDANVEIVPVKATEGVRVTPLTEQELKDLLECEAEIDRALQGFVQLGKSMAKIRDNKLYQPKYRTFEDYLDKRWGYTRQYAWNVIKASDAYVAMEGRIDTAKLPKSERAMRALLKAPEEKRSEVLDIAAKSGEPTTERIIEAIAVVIPKKAKADQAKVKSRRVIKPEDAVKAATRLTEFLESCDPSTLAKDQRKSIKDMQTKLTKAFAKLNTAA